MPRGLQLLTPPSAEPITLTEAKNWIRVDIADDDNLILRSLRSARSYVEKGWNRQLVSARWRLTLDRFPRYSSSAVWQFNSDAIWQQRLPVTQLSGQWYPDRAAIRVTRPPFQLLEAITYFDGNGVNQTLISSIALGIAAPGSQVVTPASMIGIVIGLQIVVDVGAAQETVTVTAVTATTFTATFVFAHPQYVILAVVPASTGNNPLNGGQMVGVDTTTEPARIAPGFGQIWPIVRQQLACVQVQFIAGYGPVTTIAAGVPGAGSQTVTPASMFGILPGTVLNIDTGTAWEQIEVATITATTFTAAFGQQHAAGVGIMPGLPDSWREAILMLAAHRYRNREAIKAGTMAALPLGAEALLDGDDCHEYE